MKRILVILLMFLLTGCVRSGGEEMYIAIYGRDLNHITNVTEVKYEITERVFDLDTSNFTGTTSIDISNGLIFVLCDNSGKQVYSGYIKGLKQAGNLVTFSGDDFKKGFDTEVILDYATGLNTAPKFLDEVFRDVSLAILSQHSEIQTIVPMDILFPSTNEDVLWIADYTSQYMTINANRFLKTYLAYFGYFIDSYYDKINKKVILEIKSNVETASIRLDDFTHETTRNETLTNKAVANLKFNNINTGEKVWKYIGDDSDYGYDVTRTQNTPDPEVSANEYQVGVIMHIKYIPFQSPVEENLYYQAEYLTTLRPVDLPTRTYYLGNDNLIYESSIPQEKMILPIVSKVFEEDFFQTAQFNAVSELVNSRYNENIIITNTQTPVDLSKYDLYTMIKVYDKNGLMVEMPLAEIERTNGNYKIKLGFKKTKFTEIVKSLTEDAPIKSTGVSGSGGGGGITEGNVHGIIDSEVPALIEESKQTGTFPATPHNNSAHTEEYATVEGVNIKLPLQSHRNFPDGTIINTSIDYGVGNGEAFLLEITGNAYGHLLPLDIKIQGYIYNNTIINYGGISNGTNIYGLVALNVGGNLTFWFPYQLYWQGYTVGCYAVNRENIRPINTVLSITNGVKPTGTKEVAFSITQGIWEDDTRLTDSRPASDVHPWAKKPLLDIADVPSIPTTKITNFESRLDLLSGSIFNYLLDSQNKIYENLIPAVAITDTHEASSQSAMLALSVQKGDICVRTDLNKSFVLAQSPASTLANWKELRTPTDAVLSVAGKTGAVSLNKSDVGLGNVTNESKTTMFTNPVFTGTATAPTQSISDNSTRLATTAFVKAFLQNVFGVSSIVWINHSNYIKPTFQPQENTLYIVLEG